MQGRMISLSWIPQRDIFVWMGFMLHFILPVLISVNTHLCFGASGAPGRLDLGFLTASRQVREGFAQQQAHTEALDAVFAVKSIKCFYKIYQTPVTLIVSILFVLLSQSQCYIFCCGSESSTLYWSSGSFEYIYYKYST